MNLETMRLLVAKGLTAEDLLEVEETLAGPADRSAAAVRQARYRARKKAEAEGITSDVTRDGDSDATVVINPSLSPSPLPSPHTPQPTPHPHTHPERGETRAREADPFPRPPWCPDQLWRDLKSNRKLKRMACTPTAHAKLLRDIEKYTNDEWPPGRVLEAAVARGWAAVPNDPRDAENDRPANRTDLRQAADPTRGDRPNPLLDAFLAAEAEIHSAEDPQPDLGARPALRAIQ